MKILLCIKKSMNLVHNIWGQEITYFIFHKQMNLAQSLLATGW